MLGIGRSIHESINQSFAKLHNSTGGPTRPVHRRSSSSSSSDLSDNATVVNMEVCRTRPVDPLADDDTETAARRGLVIYVGTLKTTAPVRPRASSQAIQTGWVMFEKPPSHRRCMSWSVPGSAPSYDPSAHGRRFWRHCVICQGLFNHNRLDAAKCASKTLLETSASGRSVPSGLCDACIETQSNELGSIQQQPQPQPQPQPASSVAHMGASRAELLGYISRMRKGLSADSTPPHTKQSTRMHRRGRSW